MAVSFIRESTTREHIIALDYLTLTAIKNTTSRDGIYKQQRLWAINELRRRNGLPPLEIDGLAP